MATSLFEAPGAKRPWSQMGKSVLDQPCCKVTSELSEPCAVRSRRARPDDARRRRFEGPCASDRSAERRARRSCAGDAGLPVRGDHREGRATPIGVLGSGPRHERICFEADYRYEEPQEPSSSSPSSRLRSREPRAPRTALPRDDPHRAPDAPSGWQTRSKETDDHERAAPTLGSSDLRRPGTIAAAADGVDHGPVEGVKSPREAPPAKNGFAPALRGSLGVRHWRSARPAHEKAKPGDQDQPQRVPRDADALQKESVANKTAPGVEPELLKLAPRSMSPLAR